MITIKVVKHQEQRYNTIGDWWFEDGELNIRVSNLGNKRMEFLIAIHEAIEAMLCNFAGISQFVVDEWDFSHPDEEPGDNKSAPYHKQHRLAEKVEKILAIALSISWKDYAKKINEVCTYGT